MASLTGTKIKDTYDALLKVSDNGALDGTLQTITDGLGNNSALSLSTAGASVGGTLAVSGAATLSSTLGVTGLSTLSSLAVTGNLTVDTNTLFVDATKESIGVGIAPFENSLTTSMDFEGGGGIFAYGNGVYFNGNLYYDGGWKLKATGVASNYLADGNHIFYTTASGTAGDSVSTVERVKIYNGGDISFRDSSANEAFYWDASAASLGVGTANPTVFSGYVSVTTDAASGGIFDIKVNGTRTANFQASATSALIDVKTAIPLVFNTSGTERMRIGSDGVFEVFGKTIVGSNSSNALEIHSNGDTEIAFSYSTKGNNYAKIIGDITNASPLGGEIAFQTASGGTLTERMRIASSGNVGIGTSGAIADKLVVEGSDVAITAKSTSNVSILKLINTSGTSAMVQVNDALIFDHLGTERMRITSGGYLKASNDGSYNSSTGAYHELRTNISGYILFTTNSSASPEGMVVEYTSAIPNGTGNVFYYAGDSSAVRFVVRSNGGIANYQANDVNLSDERVKTDISPLGSYWDKIKGIEIVNFKYKDQTHDDFNIGVIAQQVESVAPEFVDVDGFDNRPKVISEEVLDEEGNVIEEAVYEEPLAEPLKAVYTADLYHAAIKVLQEAMARIEVLETELNALKQA